MTAQRFGAAVTTTLVLAFTVATSAQTAKPAAATQPAPERMRVETTILNPGMVDTWESLIKNEAVPAHQKAGLPFRWTFEAGGATGTGFSYVSVTPIANFADFDKGSSLRRGMGDEAMVKYNARVRPAIMSQSAIVQTMIREATLQGSSAPPPLVRVTTFKLLPGKGAEFARLIAQEYLPALKKAGVSDYWVLATSLGGSLDERTIVTTANKWADFDMPGPLARGIGQQAADALNARRAALTSGASVTVMRYRADLSFGSPIRPSSSQQ